MLGRLRSNFSTRIFLNFFVLITALSFVIVLFIVGHQSRVLSDGLIDKGLSIVELVAYNSRLGVFTENPVYTKEIIDGVMKQKGVFACEILSFEGKRIAGSQTGAFDGQAEGDGIRQVMEKRAAVYHEHRDFLEFWAPIFSDSLPLDAESLYYMADIQKKDKQIIGFVRLVIDRKDLKSAIRSLLISSVVITAFFLLISLVVSLYIADRTTTPLKRLNESVKALAESNRFSEVPIDSTDEIGQLATAFNEMLGLLRLRESERKRADEQLGESERKFKAIFENANDGILLVDMEDRRCLIGNEALCGMLGIPCDKLSNFTIDDIISSESIETIFPASGGPTACRLVEDQVVKRQGGEVFDANITPSTIDLDGKRYWLAIIRDMTEHRQMEEMVVRTANLESLGVLAGGIAHDFNNKLAVILNNVYLAKRFVEQHGKAYEKLVEIENSYWQVTHLTKQLITFAKGDYLQRRACPIKQLLSENIEFALTGSRVTCLYDIPDRLYNVEIDEGKIAQVINNIVINAIQVMPEGGTLTVAARNIEMGESIDISLEPGEYLEISIGDTGPGIGKADIGKIFTPYFTTKQSGHGLGLAISHSIVKKHGGGIDVKSVVGQGTTFHIYLPAAKGAVMERKEEKRAEPCIIGGRILVMDDEPGMRDTLSEMLSLLGCEVSSADDGTKAVELYRNAYEARRPFDAVILDLAVQGGMGGKDAAREILDGDPDAKLIACTAYFEDAIVTEPGKYGFLGAVVKPFGVNDLAEVIYKSLKPKAPCSTVHIEVPESPGRKSVLVVEDECILAEGLSMVLGELGHTAAIALSGEEAIAIVRGRPAFDLVLMDVNLRGNIDGIEVATEINQLCDTPVVFLTGYYDDAVLKRMEGVRHLGVLEKPVHEFPLSEMIRKLPDKRA